MEFFWISLARNVLFIAIGMVMVRVGLRHYDRLLGINFRQDVFDVLRQNPMALAIYISVRCAAFCLLAGCAILGSI